MITDHASLEYIKSQNNFSRKQARWLEILQSCTFDIKYRPRKTNVVADALSRQPYLANLSVITSYLENFEKKYLEDKYFAPIYKTLKSPSQSDKKQQAYARNYELRNNKLYLKEEQYLAIPIDKKLKSKLLEEYHDIKIARHLGIDKTYEAICHDYF